MSESTNSSMAKQDGTMRPYRVEAYCKSVGLGAIYELEAESRIDALERSRYLLREECLQQVGHKPPYHRIEAKIIQVLA